MKSIMEGSNGLEDMAVSKKDDNYLAFLIDWEQEKNSHPVDNYPNTYEELTVVINWYANYWEDVDCVKTDARIIQQLVEEFLENKDE